MSDHPPPSAEAGTPPRPASTVILARPAAAGYEVFMVRRPARAAAFADAYVFPGGSLRSGDGAPDAVDGGFTGAEAFRALTERGGLPPASESEALGFFRAALRELFEEAGVLLARDGRGRLATLPRAEAPFWEGRRRAVQAQHVAFVDLVRAKGLTLDHRALAYFSHWITPPTEARRFDTRFFVAAMPEGQWAAHCNIETTDGAWITPAAALDRSADGRFPLVAPTRKHLEVLAAHPALDDLIAFARTKPIRTVAAARGSGVRGAEVSIGIGEGEW